MVESEYYQSLVFIFSGLFPFLRGFAASLHRFSARQQEENAGCGMGPPVISGGTAAFSIASHCTARAENAGRIIFTD